MGGMEKWTGIIIKDFDEYKVDDIVTGTPKEINDLINRGVASFANLRKVDWTRVKILSFNNIFKKVGAVE